jgi:hypothetical protein
MNIEFQKTYNFEIPNVSFGDLLTEHVYSILTDGRLASHFLERQLEIWFPELTFVDARGHDHVDTKGNLYDQKCFTKGGCKFMPSNQIGKGRYFEEVVAHNHCQNVAYIVCDIIDFPTVRVRFEHGKNLIEEYPKCSISFAKRNHFFA